MPLLNDQGRASYRQFLQRKLPRVFAIAPDGTTVATDGGFDPLARALQGCSKVGLTCRAYAIDTDVVWTPGPPAGAAYHLNLPANRRSALNFFYAVNADCSVRGLPKLTFTQPPAHGTAQALEARGHPHFPPGHPYAVCNSDAVAGMSGTYTPEPGFTGDDSLVMDETDLDGRHKVLRFAFTIR